MAVARSTAPPADFTVKGLIMVDGSAATSDGGFLDFEAGIASDKNSLGNLLIRKT